MVFSVIGLFGWKGAVGGIFFALEARLCLGSNGENNVSVTLYTSPGPAVIICDVSDLTARGSHRGVIAVPLSERQEG